MPYSIERLSDAPKPQEEAGSSWLRFLGAVAVCSGGAVAVHYAYRRMQAQKVAGDYGLGSAARNLALLQAARRGMANPRRLNLETVLGSGLRAAVSWVLEDQYATNDVVLEFTEFVRIPSETHAECIEVALPVAGELRVHTHLAGKHRLTVGLAAAPGDDSVTATLSGPPAARPVLQQLLFSDAVDATDFDHSGRMRLIPAATQAGHLALSYDATGTDSLVPAVVARECSVRPASATTRALVVEVDVLQSAQDACVAVILPKGAAVRSARQSLGAFGHVAGAEGEYQWQLGDLDVAGCVAVEGPASTAVVQRLVVEYTHDPQEDVLPAATLSYAAPVSASGVRAKAVVAETQTPTGEWQRSSGAGAVVCSVSHRTLYSQVLPVEMLM